MSKLIEQGGEVDWRGVDHNRTALHRSAIGGHIPVMTKLLEACWSLDARDNIEWTPLFWASFLAPTGSQGEAILSLHRSPPPCV